LQAWNLVICAAGMSGTERRTVKNFAGRDLPPRLIRWDGRDDGGASLAPGFYAFRLSAEDKAGNRAETAWQLLELGAVESGAGKTVGGGDGGVSDNGGDGKARGLERGPERQPEPGSMPIIEGDDD
jgi:hypothetical protein